VSLRTAKITVVLEDIYQSHNAAAVLRTCDCFGIQNVHIIENRNSWNPHPDIEQGSTKWLSLHRYNRDDHNTALCLKHLKTLGYSIAATTPHTDMAVDDLPVDRPVALVLGNEKEGISQVAKENSDFLVKIPMYGFTESFNISVAAAICLHAVRKNFEKSGVDLSLSPSEREEVLLNWCRNSIKGSEKIMRAFQKKG
jgi:tRNA (guanosine-2'-O-)-methyltransferase